MSDCGNAVMRDQLPEFVHGLLPVTDRATIEAHLADCDDCRAEVELLRTVQRTWAPADAQVPDVAAIVRALPRPPARVQSRAHAEPGRRARRFAPARWQLAAAALLVVAGALAMSVASRMNRGDGPSGLVTIAESGSDRPQASPDTGASNDSVLLATTTADEATISFGGGVDDLETNELEALMQAIDEIDARPIAEPEYPAPIPIESGEGASE